MTAPAWQSLPHSYPFCLLDEILFRDESGIAIARRRWTFDDPLVSETPSVQVFVVEMMAQCAGLAASSIENGGGGLIVKIDRLRLRRAPLPGRSVLVYAKTVKSFGSMAKVRSVCRQDDGCRLAAGEFLLGLQP